MKVQKAHSNEIVMVFRPLLNNRDWNTMTTEEVKKKKAFLSEMMSWKKWIEMKRLFEGYFIAGSFVSKNEMNEKNITIQNL